MSLIIIYQILQLTVNLLFNQNGHSKISVYLLNKFILITKIYNYFLHFYRLLLPLYKNQTRPSN